MLNAINIITKSGFRGGGASKIACLLYDTLSTLCEVQKTDAPQINLICKKGEHPNSEALHPSVSVGILHQCVAALSRLAGFPNLYTSELFRLKKRFAPHSSNLIHLHDIVNTVSPWSIAYLAAHFPTYITLHDCSLFTAGCLYPMECEKYRLQCGACPQLKEWPLNSYIDGTTHIHKIKKNLFPSLDITLITPSHWMKNMVDQTALFKHEAIVIPNGVNTNIYNPNTASDFSIPPNLPIKLDPNELTILCCGGIITDERKGMSYAIEAINRWHKNPNIIIVGDQFEQFQSRLRTPNVFFTGYLSDESQMAQWLQAADLMILPSLADNFPNVALESLACGTPIIGFETGGIPEVVIHKKNGLIVPQKDIDGLVEALNYADQHRRELSAWSKSAVEGIQANYTIEQCARQHMALYERGQSK